MQPLAQPVRRLVLLDLPINPPPVLCLQIVSAQHVALVWQEHAFPQHVLQLSTGPAHPVWQDLLTARLPMPPAALRVLRLVLQGPRINPQPVPFP